jgi:uncharacterized protein (TIGR00252 family)
MTNYASGHAAEEVAAEYLSRQGYEILEKNWRTRYCEIDIVARHKNTVYFVEVKYRRTNKQGSGLEYVTPKKLQQMQFAAEMWVSDHKWKGGYQLAALEVSGENYEVTNFLTDWL